MTASMLSVGASKYVQSKRHFVMSPLWRLDMVDELFSVVLYPLNKPVSCPRENLQVGDDVRVMQWNVVMPKGMYRAHGCTWVHMMSTTQETTVNVWFDDPLHRLFLVAGCSRSL